MHYLIGECLFFMLYKYFFTNKKMIREYYLCAITWKVV